MDIKKTPRIAWFAKIFSWLDIWAIRAVGERFNPFSRLGALAISSIAIALVTGVALLPFYSVSINGAYQSVLDLMRNSPRSLGLLHSIHRYSSDIAVFFGFLHLLRMIGTGAFLGARTFSWVTGWISFVALWLVGWLGVWLVWDASGFMVARSLARLLDQIGLFGFHLEPSLAFDTGTNDKIFFIVFFLHMLVPLALFLALWLHVSKVNRPRFLVDRLNWTTLAAFLIFLALLIPAPMDEPADFFQFPKLLWPDWPFMSAFVFFQNWSPLTFTSVTAVLFIFACSMPWMFKKYRPAPSFVTSSMCAACNNCFVDCPYEAIEMLPRENHKHSQVAFVLANRCVGCGICNGSCDSLANNLPGFATKTVIQEIDQLSAGKNRILAFSCVEDPSGRKIDGAAEIQLPCIGHIGPGSVKRAFDKGFEEVKILACHSGSCTYREGDQWARERLFGHREPSWSFGEELRKKIEFIQVAPTKGAMRWVATGLLIGLSLAIFAFANRVPFKMSYSNRANLMVSFRHAPSIPVKCRPLSEEEQAKMLAHMRVKEICERGRAESKLMVSIDGQEVFNRHYQPLGFKSDMLSIGTIELPLEPGHRMVRVEIVDEGAPASSTLSFNEEIDFQANHRYLINYYKDTGFKLYQAQKEAH